MATGSFGSGAVELGVGFVSVVPSARGFSKELDKQISGPAAKVGRDAGRSMSSALGKTLKVGAIAAGTAAVAGVGMALKGGWDRALDIDNSRRVLTGLYDDAAKAGDMLQRIEKIGSASSLDTSAYMSAAEGLAYIGVEGDRAERILTNVGDAIVGTGGSSEQLETVNGALSNMVNLGKVNREELIQLSNAGVPVFEGLATHLGVTVEEMNKMVSSGAVGLEDVLSVMENATGEYFGLVLDSADEVEKGFAATWASVKDNISQAIGSVIAESSAFDSLAPTLERVGNYIVGIINSVGELDFSSWSNFTDSLGSTGGIFDSIKNSLVELRPAFAAMRDALPEIGSAALKLGTGALEILAKVLGFLARNVDTIIKFLPALLAGYAAWRIASAALAGSQMRLMLAQTMMAPVFLASNILRFAAVRAEERLAAAQARSTGSTVANTAATGTNTGATAVNTGAQNSGIFARIRATAAMVGHRIAMVAGTVATWAATAATSALGVAMAVATSPITLIVIAIAALVAGLVWFFTQTEIGQKIWDGFVNALSVGWEWVKNAFATAWAFIQPVLMGLWNVIQTVGAVFVNIVKAYLIAYWNILSTVISVVWNTIIKPVWDAMKLALQALGQFFTWVWNAVIKPAWDALGAGIAWVWNMIIRPAWDALKAALGAIGDFFSWVWNSIIKPAWDALGNGISWVVDNVVTPAFDGIGRGLETLKGWFTTAVDAIGRTWDTIRDKVSAPIRFVIDKVYNNGIRVVWEKISDFIGLDAELPHVELGFARGGVLPGYTPGRDVHQFASPTGGRLALSGGEAIMRPEWTRAVGGPGAVEAMNRAARTGSFVSRYANDDHRNPWNKGIDAAFANGGVIGSITGLVNRFFPGMSITSTRRNTNDYHGQGLAVDFSNGIDTTPEMQAASRFFHDNYAPALLELIHWPLNGWNNIKNGAPLNYGAATNAGHRNHVHVASAGPLPEPGQPITPVPSGGGGGGGFINWIRDKIADVVSSVMDPIGSMIPELPGTVGQFPRAAFDWIEDKVVGFIRGQGEQSGYGGPVGAGVEQWRGLVESILADKGLPLSLANSTLRRMNQESGGNPRAINNWDSNAAAGTPSKGLMQTIDPTFQAYMDPGYGNIWDPEANIRASMNYAIARYGSLPAAYDRAGGYDQGGILKQGVTMAVNESGKPEAILTNQQWADISALVRELHFLTPEMKRWVDEGLVELERIANVTADAMEHNRQVGEIIMRETNAEFGKSVRGAMSSAGDSFLGDAFGTVGFPGFDRWTAVGDAWSKAQERRRDAEAEVIKSRAERADAVSASDQGVKLDATEGGGDEKSTGRVNNYYITTRDENATVRKLKQKDRMAMMGGGL